MLDRGPLLSDFGLAKLISDNNLSVTQSIVGTPHYIAPEVWEGQSNTSQADIYALGCILYELLTGQKLFQGQTPPSIMMAHFRPLPLPERWPTGVPAEVSHILATALANRPADRFTTADELALALAGLAQPDPDLVQAVAELIPAQPNKEASVSDQPALLTAPVLTTKLYAPPLRPNLVPRPRLTQQLAQGLRPGCKLLLVSAPAGFGKTTVVTEWLNQNAEVRSEKVEGKLQPFDPSGFHLSPSHVVWLSLDEEDNDPVRFLTYLVAALQKLGPAIGQSLRHLPQMPPAESLTVLLINDLAAVSAPFVLVLDDFHLIRIPLIHDVVNHLVERQPSQMHLVMTSREDPPLPLSRLRVRGQLVELRQGDLRFTAEEATAFLNQSMGLDLTLDAVKALEARTEGWIAGLQLAALSLQGSSPERVVDFIDAFSGSHRYVIDYLVEEVIQQQPEDIRHFLTQTAILDRLTAALCNAVANRTDSKTILTRLEQANLFLIPLDDRREWYRYHHLFADFLRTEQDPSQQAILHQKAARWFETNGFLPEAIKHALAAPDVEVASRLIKKAADSYLKNNEVVTLSAWLDLLPDDAVRADSELALYKGWTLWLLGQTDAADVFAQAAGANLIDEAPVAKEGADPLSALRGKLLALQACLTLTRDGTGAELVKKALAHIDEADIFYRGMILLVLGEAQNLWGDTSGAIETFTETLRLGQKYKEPLLIIGGMINVAQQLNWQGRRREAVVICRQAIDQFTAGDEPPLPWVGMAYIALGEFECYAHNLSQAGAYVHQGLEICQPQAMIAISMYAKFVLALILNAQGEAEQALAQMREVQALTIQGNYEWYRPYAAAFEIEFQVRQGNLAPAEAWAETIDLPASGASNLVHEVESLTLARLWLAKNRAAEAYDLLVETERTARAGERYLLVIMVLILQTRALAALNRNEEALTKLKKALSLAAPEDYSQIFLSADQTVINLLAQGRPAAPEFVDDLVKKSKASTPKEEAASEDPSAFRLPPSDFLIEPLSERELEMLDLVAAGRSNREIAEATFITVGTVKKHLNNVFGKLGVKNRTEAVARARELDLLS